jgi:hypothetical protein
VRGGMSNTGGSSDQAAHHYPRVQLWRIIVAPFVYLVGWALWEAGFFIRPMATSVNSQPTLKWDNLITTGAAIVFPVAIFHVGRDITPFALLVSFSCFAYWLAMLGALWVVVFRPRPRVIWFWRVVSLGTLWPWYFFDARFDATDVIVWAIGSELVGLTFWVSPAKISGEPCLSLTVLAREILRINAPRLPSPDGAFPVIRDNVPPSRAGQIK